MRYIFVILLLFPIAFAGEIDQCNQLHDKDRKHLCMGAATLSVGECDKISNLDLKISCVHKVRDGQRKVNSFQPMKDKKATTE
jgi:hypothetical protein